MRKSLIAFSHQADSQLSEHQGTSVALVSLCNASLALWCQDFDSSDSTCGTLVGNNQTIQTLVMLGGTGGLLSAVGYLPWFGAQEKWFETHSSSKPTLMKAWKIAG